MFGEATAQSCCQTLSSSEVNLKIKLLEVEGARAPVLHSCQWYRESNKRTHSLYLGGGQRLFAVCCRPTEEQRATLKDNRPEISQQIVSFIFRCSRAFSRWKLSSRLLHSACTNIWKTSGAASISSLSS